MWPNLQETADLVTFIEEIFNGKFYFLCSLNKATPLYRPIFCQLYFWHEADYEYRSKLR